MHTTDNENMIARIRSDFSKLCDNFSNNNCFIYMRKKNDKQDKPKINNPRRDMPFAHRDIPFNGGQDADKQRDIKKPIRG